MKKEREKTILVVDDDKSILESVKLILEGEGYVVETAETGREAVEKSENCYCNLALLDVRLPDMEGTELLTRIAKRIPRTRAIMITGYPSLESAVKSMNLGADGYLLKPIEPEDLLKVIEEKLGEQEAEARRHDQAEKEPQTDTMLKYYEPL